MNQADLDEVKKLYNEIIQKEPNEEWSSNVAGSEYSSIANFNHELKDYVNPSTGMTTGDKLRTRHFNKVKEAIKDLKEISPNLDKKNKKLYKELSAISEASHKIELELEYNLKKDEWITSTYKREEQFKKWDELYQLSKKLKKAVDKAR